jgi:hypothetical protein
VPNELVPLAVPPVPDATAFSLYPKPRPRRDAPGRDLDDRFFKLMGPRR